MEQDKKRYVVRTGRFGMYLRDSWMGEDLDLETTCRLLNAENWPAALEIENAKLRTMIAFCHTGGDLYVNDGELLDNHTQPFIDFKRDPVSVIEGKLAARWQAEVKEEKT